MRTSIAKRVVTRCVLVVGIGLGLALAAGGPRLAAAEPHAASSAEHGAAEAAHPEGAPLSFKADLAFWSGITFLVFLLVLTKFAWRPLMTGLAQRESSIHDNIAQAESARLKAEQMLAEHVKKLAKVQDEVREILAEARRDAEHTKSEILAEAQRESEAAKQRAVSEIRRARDAALKDLFDVMANDVALATEHVLGRALNSGDQDRLIREALAELPQR